MALDVIRVGLVGLGNMGRNHLRVLTLLRGFDLVFVCDDDAAVADKTGKTYGVPGVVDPTLYLAEVDAIVIATPTVTHAHYIRLCAPHVKNIFVEKPLAATLQEAREIRSFARENDLNIQVGFIERFNPAVQSLNTVLARTDQVISLDFTRTNKVSARITDVDVITDLMIHDIDLALYFNGPALSVVAHGFSGSEMTDFASALITHENGRFSRILASRITDKKIRSISGTCSDMYVDCNLLSKEIQINRQSRTTMSDDEPYAISAIQETVAVYPQEALLSELQAFWDSCTQRGEAERPGVDAGVAAMEICHQIRTAVEAN